MCRSGRSSGRSTANRPGRWTFSAASTPLVPCRAAPGSAGRGGEAERNLKLKHYPLIQLTCLSGLWRSGRLRTLPTDGCGIGTGGPEPRRRDGYVATHACACGPGTVIWHPRLSFGNIDFNAFLKGKAWRKSLKTTLRPSFRKRTNIFALPTVNNCRSPPHFSGSCLPP